MPPNSLYVVMLSICCVFTKPSRLGLFTVYDYVTLEWRNLGHTGLFLL